MNKQPSKTKARKKAFVRRNIRGVGLLYRLNRPKRVLERQRPNNFFWAHTYVDFFHLPPFCIWKYLNGRDQTFGWESQDILQMIWVYKKREIFLQQNIAPTFTKYVKAKYWFASGNEISKDLTKSTQPHLLRHLLFNHFIMYNIEIVLFLLPSFIAK